MADARFSRKKDFSWANKEEALHSRNAGHRSASDRTKRAASQVGSGVIVDAEGQGGDARVQVNFGSQA